MTRDTEEVDRLKSLVLAMAERIAAQAELLSRRAEKHERHQEKTVNRNCLSYWFPKLAAAGLPVPRTRIVRADIDLTPLCDGKEPEGFAEFLDRLRMAAIAISESGPWFLRTGQGSGKHDWRHTCQVADLARIGFHVRNLVEWSHLVSFFGLAHDVWCVREMLPVTPVARLPRYGDMPLVREVRAFVEDGKVACIHPYWPEGSIRQGMDRTVSEAVAQAVVSGAKLSMAEAMPALLLAENVAPVFAGDGAWSVDLLETRNGWYVTDMAVAGESYHWPDCANQTRWGQQPSMEATSFAS